MVRIPRHRFVPARYAHLVHQDHPLPIGYGQTISQPSLVAVMTGMLNLRAGDRVLEIGTGSGYQAALLAELGMDVYTMEIVPQLAEQASTILAVLGYSSVHVVNADGYEGWTEHAPYDAVIITAAVSTVPPSLLEQLRPHGRMLVPVGFPDETQRLWLFEKQPNGGHRARNLGEVLFVPLTRWATTA
jgi:protein-L-isoaspartate(D-aspartate) O-methyltransferase